MKKKFTYLFLSAMVLLISCGTTRRYSQPVVTSAPPPNITYQQFYDDLSPYGQWVSYQNYGYVWSPYEQGFRPYYNNGQWIYTDYGWTWVSNYEWGWAPFHYGRWLYDMSFGWLWVPGYEWAPAWVAWRSGGDYYGWAPLGPGINITINTGRDIPYDYWAFVPKRYISSPRINTYYINREKNVTIINNTTIINERKFNKNNRAYIPGPSEKDVESVTREKIRPVRLEQRNAPGPTEIRNTGVSIYQPAVRELPQSNQQTRPSRIDNLNDVRQRHQSAEKPGNDVRDNRPQENRINPANRESPLPQPQKTNPPSPVIQNQIPAQRDLNDKRQVEKPGNSNRNADVPSPNEPPNRQGNNRDRTTPEKNVPAEKPNPGLENKPGNLQPNSRSLPGNNDQRPPVKIPPGPQARTKEPPIKNPVNKQTRTPAAPEKRPAASPLQNDRIRQIQKQKESEEPKKTPSPAIKNQKLPQREIKKDDINQH